MTYYESAEAVEISHARAIRELTDHGFTDFADFYEECGELDTYDAQEVLGFLGY